MRALVSQVFTFGAEQRLVGATANPVIGVKKPTKETTRDRVLTDGEIRRLWDACATQNPYVCAWFRLRLVTAQRGGELLQMRWQDFDPKSHFWTIFGEFVKNAHGHRIFLNETARKTLAGVPKLKKPKNAVWVFPKSLMGDYKHVGRRLAQSTRANIVVEPKTNGKARDRVDIRGHDLRRTAASLMASGGVPRFVISRILNHSEDKDITSVYDRFSYDLLGLALAMPSTVMGQPRMVPADQVTKTWIFDTNLTSIERRGFVGREGVRPAIAGAATTTPDSQQAPQRNWAGRHPVALGAIIGTAGGALWGASLCWKQVCGDSHGPLLVAFGAGLGAGIGAGVGVAVAISLSTR